MAKDKRQINHKGSNSKQLLWSFENLNIEYYLRFEICLLSNLLGASSIWPFRRCFSFVIWILVLLYTFVSVQTS